MFLLGMEKDMQLHASCVIDRSFTFVVELCILCNEFGATFILSNVNCVTNLVQNFHQSAIYCIRQEFLINGDTEK